MSKRVILLHGVSKQYKLYERPVDRIKEALSPLRRKYHNQFSALQDINLQIGQGECTGIVGMNGSGKSTLLKLICGVLTPGSGTVEVTGRITALLELGAGFNPDFTGLENIYFQGTVSGYTRAEIDRVRDEIIAFADIGEFIHHPVRTYSSGMFVRLAFAIAVCVEPDILVIDEALAVGDAGFQAKCFARIREIKERGATILFVSHDAEAVKTLCDSAYLLHRGRVVQFGPPAEVLDYYNALLHPDGAATVQKKTAGNKAQITSGSGEAAVQLIELRNSAGKVTEQLRCGEAAELVITVEVNQPLARLVLGYMIKDRLGRVMFGTNTWHTGQVEKKIAAGEQLEYRIQFRADLGPGNYSISIALVDSATHLQKNYQWSELMLLFEVYNDHYPPFIGCAPLHPQVSIKRTGK